MNHTTHILLCLLFWVAAGPVSGQDFFLPVSTSSTPAQEAYRTASHLASNIHFADAREKIDEALAADPDYFMALVYSIQVLAAKKDKPALIERALAIDPAKFTPAERIMREYLVALRDKPDASPAASMKKLVQEYPTVPEAFEWAYLHAAYSDKDDEAAERYALRLTELAPDFPPVYNGLGYLKMGQGLMAEAKTYFDKYLALAPDEANAYDSMAEYYAENKDYAASVRYYNQAAAMGMPAAYDRVQQVFTDWCQATGESGEPEPTGDPALAQKLEHVESVWDRIINQGQIGEINPANFASDIRMVSEAGDVVGIEDFRAHYQHYLTGFSDIDFTVESVFGQGDRLVKHWRFAGKHTGEFFGVPPTGKSVDVEGVTLIRMRNGKIAQEQDFMNDLIFYEQLGLQPQTGDVALIQGVYDAFSAGDIPTVLQALDAKIVWNEAEGNALADGNPYVGPDAVLNGVFARLGAEHDYFKLKDIKLHAVDGNRVLATLRYDARRKDSGKVIDAQVAHLWTTKNGKVTAFQQYADTHQLAEAAKK
ncbi:nuclear transport factor 2 family protein [Lewinella sp. JB7]|uniref:nuclear transport factor 2 family protein n=1 Tax=Lewinella sp. JB7 TaxID=2962887 RepID=UPI0020CA21AD|nr:nuclear transport factor 2 family protein [Lewinella sp. JB7]MCP9237348.1 nuclear transport factor 2 family protein [Lewinella sp. JB7]